MIQSISIQNFKSVIDLKLDLGKFNVLIGENGCGKSNILESIAFGAAASVNKLDREFFTNRGIRYTDPSFMYSAFNKETDPIIYIDITYKTDTNINLHSEHFKLKLNSDIKPAKWEDLHLINQIKELSKILSQEKFKEYNNLFTQIQEITQKSPQIDDTYYSKKTKDTNRKFLESKLVESKLVEYIHFLQSPKLNDYLIYSLEESILRKFDTENAIYPLGRNGEGLFSYLKKISQKDNGIEILNEIKSNLDVLDWFDDLEIPKDQLSNEFSLHIKDKYINDTLHFFDQRSTNEGFLYLLFYLTLFISDETPSFFAIDNLEASFNPKLCREVTRRLIQLAKKHNKQVIVTTHSPAILDGLDITNNDERLFVVRRNIDGYTKANRVEYKTTTNLALSEAWLKGYIGGLPENF